METLYTKIGGNKLMQLVDVFYDKVFLSEKIAPLFKNDKEEIKEKQFLFLSQFLGGPQLYTEKYGHPKMRARHLPHAITEDAKNEWLRCMKLAIETLDLSDDLKIALYNCFPAVAQHMVNR
jgi:hemoglobin